MKGIREIPNDTTLPHLWKALDASVMLKQFQHTLFETEQSRQQFQVTDCEVVYVKYKPYKPCTICYHVVIRDTHTQQIHTQLHSARMFQLGDSRLRYDNAKTSRLIPPSCGHALVHIPEYEMVIWSFPNDRKLRVLPELTDPSLVREKLLPDLLVKLFCHDWTIVRSETTVMNYVPRHSCTVKVTFQMRGRQFAEKKSVTLYGKTYVNHTSGEHASAVLHELWETEARKSGEFRMAQPAWYDTTRNIFWQFAIPGTTLLQWDMRSRPFVNLLEQAGAMIATLHSLPVTRAQQTKVQDRASGLHYANLALTHLEPPVMTLLQTTITLLIDQWKGLGDQPETTLHGDLHFKNFIVDGTSVAMIDLDEIGRGSPFHDMGSCISFLLYQGQEMGLVESRIEALVKVFVQGYRRRATWDVPEPVLRWHVAAALIDERVRRCLKKAKPGTVKQVERLLKLASHLVCGNRKIPMGDSLPPVSMNALLPSHLLIVK
ncbi:MAG: aminoglycoside phosphotransferase family protein [Nitrospirota bacterium]|nr:aminoglycoside phosphotransferase family protein [Nitrospirota bacterium]